MKNYGAILRQYEKSYQRMVGRDLYDQEQQKNNDEKRDFFVTATDILGVLIGLEEPFACTFPQQHILRLHLQ